MRGEIPTLQRDPVALTRRGSVDAQEASRLAGVLAPASPSAGTVVCVAYILHTSDNESDYF